MNFLKTLWFKIPFGLMTLMLVLGTWLARGPDQELHFSREIQSDLDVVTLGKAMSDLKTWPIWHSFLTEVQTSKSNQALASGTELNWIMVPKKQSWRKFELSTRVTSYEPNRWIEIQFEKDSKEKISKMFDLIKWKVELLPTEQASGSKTLIRGTLVAHTRNWRSRLFGRLNSRTLLNQIFYPDLFKLADLPRATLEAANPRVD